MSDSTTNVQNFIDEERAVSDIDSRLDAMRARKVAAEAEQELLALEAAELLRLANALRSIIRDLAALSARPGFSRETDAATYSLAFEKAAAAKQELLEFYLESATYQQENIKHVIGVNITGTQLALFKPVLDIFRNFEPETRFLLMQERAEKMAEKRKAAKAHETNREIFAVVGLSALVPVVLIALAIF